MMKCASVYMHITIARCGGDESNILKEQIRCARGE